MARRCGGVARFCSSGGGVIPPPGVPLLSLYDGQFSRDQGALVSCLTAANRLAILGGDIMRRQDRGIGKGCNFFVEPTRVNYLKNTVFFPAPWAVANGAVLTPQSTIGPDSYRAHLASLLAFPASAIALIGQTINVGSVAVPVDTPIVFSVWAKNASGNGAFRFQVVNHDGVTLTSPVQNAATNWKRFYFLTTAGANAAAVYVCRLLNGDATARSIFFAHPMLEAAPEMSSYILNDTTGNGYSAPDVLEFAPAQVPERYRSGKSSGVVYCSRSSANIVALNDRMCIRSFGSSADTLELGVDGGQAKLIARTGGVVRATSQALALAEYDELAYVVDPVAGSLVVNGVAGPLGTPWTWPAGVPFRLGGFVGGSGNEFRGEIGQEYVA